VCVCGVSICISYLSILIFLGTYSSDLAHSTSLEYPTHISPFKILHSRDSMRSQTVGINASVAASLGSWRVLTPIPSAAGSDTLPCPPCSIFIDRSRADDPSPQASVGTGTARSVQVCMWRCVCGGRVVRGVPVRYVPCRFVHCISHTPTQHTNTRSIVRGSDRGPKPFFNCWGGASR